MIETTTEIRCPRCNSNQLTANKKGFNGKNAVVGGLLTGGIGLLAGTVGSNKVKITCLACGNEFRPGQGKTVIIPVIQQEPIKNEIKSTPKPSRVEQNSSTAADTKTQKVSTGADISKLKFLYFEPVELDPIDKDILEIYTKQSISEAEKYCMTAKNLNSEEAKVYVDKLATENGVRKEKPKPKPASAAKPSGGCFIATACYGDYDAPEVMILRSFRDEKLIKTYMGNLFIKFYYSVSPFFAGIISKSDRLKKVVRQYMLQPIINRIQK